MVDNSVHYSSHCLFLALVLEVVEQHGVSVQTVYVIPVRGKLLILATSTVEGCQTRSVRKPAYDCTCNMKED